MEKDGKKIVMCVCCGKLWNVSPDALPENRVYICPECYEQEHKRLKKIRTRRKKARRRSWGK